MTELSDMGCGGGIITIDKTKADEKIIWSGYIGKHPDTTPFCFYIRDGIIRGEKTKRVDYSLCRRLCLYVVSLGYAPNLSSRFNALQIEYELPVQVRYRISSTLYNLIGHPFEEFESEVKKWTKTLELGREKRKKQQYRFELFDDLDPIIVGIDRHVDVFPTGFNVRVLCSSSSTFAERKKYVCEHKKEVLKRVIKSIDTVPCMKRRIKDVSFFQPVEIVCLRIPEIEVKFSVKGEVNDMG